MHKNCPSSSVSKLQSQICLPWNEWWISAAHRFHVRRRTPLNFISLIILILRRSILTHFCLLFSIPFSFHFLARTIHKRSQIIPGRGLFPCAWWFPSRSMTRNPSNGLPHCSDMGSRTEFLAILPSSVSGLSRFDLSFGRFLVFFCDSRRYWQGIGSSHSGWRMDSILHGGGGWSWWF